MKEVATRLRSALAGRYTLERELGRGGMATVWLAEERHPRRHVALKVLRPEIAQALGPERFLREVDLAAKLTHPHILPIHSAGEADGLLYYTMPYVEGESLRDRLNREKQLPLDDALQIAREVADALSYAHSHAVVHRDIKPENILLESGHAVVADFGIARAITAAGGERLTDTGIAVGTPAYMSPEQGAGSGELDGRSDLYSLGCVLYEMLAGRPPFVGPTAESVVHQHLVAEPPAITGIRPAVPAHVAATLQRALAKNLADRFNPVALFAEALGPRASAAVTTLPPAPSAPVFPRRSWQRVALLGGAAMAVIAGAVVVGRWLGSGSNGPAYPRTAVAVLPFETLGLDDTHRTFVDGLHTEVLTQLAKVGALTVRGRTSVMGYAGTGRSVKEVARDLEVGTLLEANVQIIGRRLRLNVRLVHAVTEVQLWAERYEGTIDDAFAIQTDLAQRIVTAVGATLAGAERAAIVAPPTASAEAYTLYLQARGYWARPGYDRRNWETAQDLYERAMELDSGFALAHAALSELHGLMHWLQYDPSPARVARQRAEAEVALRLAPHLAEAHVAMGLAHYWGRRDYRAALEELRAASVGLPNDARLWEVIGFVERRLGNWDEAVGAFERAVRLDSRNADLYWNLGGITYRIMHRYADAVRMTDRALHLAPDLQNVAIRRGWLYVAWRGQFDTLRATLRRTSPDAPLAELGNRTVQHLLLLHWDRQADSLLQIVSAMADSVFQGQEFFLPGWLLAGWAHTMRGDGAAARVAFDRALLSLDSAARAWPDDYRIHAARGLALAGLGRRDEALEEARWLQRSVVYREDANAGGLVAEARAHILAQVGEADAAVEEIERLLARPSWLSVHALRMDPLWDPIRAHPRFGASLRRPAAIRAPGAAGEVREPGGGALTDYGAR